MNQYVIAIDQGTTSSRFIVFDRAGNTVGFGAARTPADFPAGRLGGARSRGNLEQQPRVIG